ncbi:YwmB family TATA-box binding protein [Priestia flexa]|uniref:YwmB family TATA-box binding protein n=1 Tax=Priestia flexa TaxID=86664 RepID=UPI00077C1BEA|nr:YwmB family TATA-box binding protein [Priestia flexa]MED4590515.1 YwmB family TATA-box binding protein [Priestia flexa]
MGKKISVFLAIFIVGVIVYYGSYVTNAQASNSTLEKMVNVLNKEAVEMKEWSLYAREEATDVTSLVNFQMKSKQLQTKYKGFKWDIKRENGVWKAKGTRQAGSVKELIMLTYTGDKKSTGGYISYELIGQEFTTQNVSDAEGIFKDNYEKLFLTNPLIFSCIKGEINDKMESVLSLQVKQLLTAFNAQQIESLMEESFVSVSAYTGLWEEALSSQQQEMNLQIALRKTGMGDQTTLVVGTPIITSEY